MNKSNEHEKTTPGSGGLAAPDYLDLAGVAGLINMKNDANAQPVSGAHHTREPEYENSQHLATRLAVSVRATRSRLCFRLLLLAVSAFQAVLIWWITHSIVFTLTIFVFGCRATRLISEKTLVKILPWNRK